MTHLRHTARLFQTVPVILGVTLVTFLLTRILPGDLADVLLGPAASEEARQQLRAAMGLDCSLIGHNTSLHGHLMRGELGTIAGVRPARGDRPGLAPGQHRAARGLAAIVLGLDRRHRDWHLGGAEARVAARPWPQRVGAVPQYHAAVLARADPDPGVRPRTALAADQRNVPASAAAARSISPRTWCCRPSPWPRGRWR